MGRAPPLPCERMGRGLSGGGHAPGLEASLGELGIDLRSQRNVELDLAERPNKTPRAFCAPIEVPGRIVLVIQPIGGPDDWHALFHEAGHTGTSRTPPPRPVEARRLGDNSVTEGWAALVERLVNDRVWLGRRLDFGGIDEFVAEAAARTSTSCAATAASSSTSWSFTEGPSSTRCARATSRSCASDGHRAFGIGLPRRRRRELLRVLLPALVGLGGELRNHLRHEFGSTWFTQRDAGSLVASSGTRARAWMPTSSSGR